MPWSSKPVKEQEKQSKEDKEEMPEKKPDIELRKEVAKIAMTASLGAAVFTAPFLKGNRTAKNIHTGAGVLLAGFALWHHLLYQPEKRKVRRAKKKQENTTENQA